jgi:hypothetical protein
MKGYRFLLFLIFLFALAGLMPGWAPGEAGAVPDEKSSVPQETITDTRGDACPPRPAAEECPGTFGPIITDTAIPIAKGMFSLQPTFYLGWVLNNLDKNWRRVSAGGDYGSFLMEYRLTYGVWNNTEAFIVIPVWVTWVTNADDPGPHGERAASYAGLGDLNFTLKYQFVQEGAKMPNITALFATNFPTGRFHNLNPCLLGVDEVGAGSLVFTAGLNMSKYLKPFIVYGNLWYSMSTAYTGDSGRVFPRDYVTVNLAAEYPLKGKWVALLELTSFWDAGRLFGRRANTAPQALLSLMPGIEYMATQKFSLAMGVNIDLTGKNYTASVTPILSMVYAF